MTKKSSPTPRKESKLSVPRSAMVEPFFSRMDRSDSLTFSCHRNPNSRSFSIFHSTDLACLYVGAVSYQRRVKASNGRVLDESWPPVELGGGLDPVRILEDRSTALPRPHRDRPRCGNIDWPAAR